MSRFYFDREDFWHGLMLSILVALSTLITPNAYINPVTCVLWWGFTLLVLSWWYEDRSHPIENAYRKGGKTNEHSTRPVYCEE